MRKRDLHSSLGVTLSGFGGKKMRQAALSFVTKSATGGAAGGALRGGDTCHTLEDVQ